MSCTGIGYFADGPWAYEAFRLLVSDKTVKISFVCGRYNANDKTLKTLAEEYGIDYLEHKNINSPEFLELISSYQCDLFVSMSFNQIFKDKIINLPRLKTINCHAGKLPYYRGRNILNWVLINDETEYGITVHYVDEGVDTGDIILQRTYQITDDSTYRILLKQAYTECAKILYDSIKLFQEGNVKPVKQSTIHPVGTYFTRRIEGDELLDWKQSSREIFNFVRAICKPGPKARAWLKSSEMKINKVEMVNDSIQYKCIPGAVVGITGNAILVKTMDSIIRVVEYDFDDDIRIGDRFV